MRGDCVGHVTSDLGVKVIRVQDANCKHARWRQGRFRRNTRAHEHDEAQAAISDGAVTNASSVVARTSIS